MAKKLKKAWKNHYDIENCRQTSLFSTAKVVAKFQICYVLNIVDNEHLFATIT